MPLIITDFDLYRSTIKERSSEFTRKLVMAGVGKRSIVWACHSMGGLLVKQLLVEGNLLELQFCLHLLQYVMMD